MVTLVLTLTSQHFIIALPTKTLKITKLKSSENQISFKGKLATYEGGGYVQNFHFEQNVTEALLMELKTNRWLERGTRLVTIDFTVYNANINLFCVSKLVFEFPPTGGIIRLQR